MKGRVTTGKNYVALYQGLLTFRNSMLPFLIERLQVAYGKGWWTAGVRRALGEAVSDQLEANYSKRYDKALPVVSRPGTEQWEMLDINRFLPIIQANWKRCFSDVFEQRDQVEVWLREINDVRNAVAHPESGDVPDDDAWRTLDTMVRLLRTVNPAEADRIAQLKKEALNMGPTRPAWDSLREGPFDYELGLAQLDQKVSEREGKESEEYITVMSHRRQLHEVWHERKQIPGYVDNSLEIRKVHILNDLERLAQHYLGTSFIELCNVAPIPATPEDSLKRIRELRMDIEKARKQLSYKELKKLAQEQTGETIMSLEREIEGINSQLDQKQKELSHLEEVAAPSAFFSVKRKFKSDGRRSYAEEQPFSVLVEITNLGRRATSIEYKEGLSEHLKIKDGTLELNELVSPGATATVSYTCYGDEPGQHRIFTEFFTYDGRIAVWDQIEETTVEVKRGKDPQLIAARYYRHETDGLKLLVSIENKGDRVARNVKYRDEVWIEGQTEPLIVAFEGDIWSEELKEPIECQVSVKDDTKIQFSEKTFITYSDGKNTDFQLVVDSGWKRVEYNFPQSPTSISIVGREAQLQVISEMIDQIWSVGRGQYISWLKRLLFINGIEGAGKTRLVYELIGMAENRGLRCFAEDSKDRSPVKKMIRRLLGLRPDEDNDRLILERLKENFPGDEENPQMAAIFRFISTMPAKFDRSELDSLGANVHALIKKLCQQSPTVLIFENIHWTPEGVEEQLLLRLFHGTLSSADEPVLLCATSRPAEIGPLPVVTKLQMSPDQYQEIQLDPIDERAARGLVDQIVDFPRLSESVFRFVYDWSHGNPFYLIELLRLLVHPDSTYLLRVGSEWYPARNIRLEDVIPKTKNIEQVILMRVEQELPEEADFAAVLSAIGFELPLTIIKALAVREFPEWPSRELYRRLDVLHKAGLLVSGADRTGVEGYEFEHQLKREVLYKNLPEGRRQELRQRIAEILLTEKVFLDPDEETRQLARHIINSPEDFRRAHLKEIRRAASLERDLRNFSRSLDFCNAALKLVRENDVQTVALLIERSRLYQMRGNWAPAESDLVRAYELLSLTSPVVKADNREIKQLRITVEKERGRVMIRQSNDLLLQANDYLYRARVGMEGSLRLRRFFPPKDKSFYRDLVEIYLALAEIWLRSRSFRLCRRACRRAEKLARKARKTLQDNSLLSEVYLSLGNLYLERGREQKYYHRARDYYEQALKYAGTDLYEQERIYVALADAARALNDLDQARQHYEKAIELQKIMGDVHGLAMSYGGIGGLLVAGGFYEQGKYCCDQAYQYQQLTGDVSRLWRTCYSLAKVYHHDGDVEKAGEYWLQARAILFGQTRFESLSGKERDEIYDFIVKFANYYQNKGRLDEWTLCLKDLKDARPFADRGERASVQMDLGEASFRKHDWAESIAAFSSALELADTPAARAKAHEWLGDIYSSSEAPVHRFDLEVAQDEVHDQAERHYEDAVKELIRTNNFQQAVAVFGKLLSRIVIDEAGLSLLPFTFSRILRVIMRQRRIPDAFVSAAVDLLIENEKIPEAGDILVYTARVAARADNSVIPFEEKLSYLRHAERIYRRGQPADLIWGWNMLIPTYQRLELWDEIVRGIEESFNLYLDVKDVEGFIESFRAISIFHDKIEIAELEGFLNTALSGPDIVEFSPDQQMKLLLYAARNYSNIAGKLEESENPGERRRYNDLALEYYERVRKMATPDTAIVATALNDSALIYQRRNDYDEALARLNESIRIDEQYRGRTATGAGHHNRAIVYANLRRMDEARRDFELALEYESGDVDYWNDLLQNQDERPLSPIQVFQMVHLKRGLAATCSHFASFLLRSDPARAQELALESARLFQEIGMPEEARVSKEMVSLADVFFDGTSLHELLRSHLSQVSGCPSCSQLLPEGVLRCHACDQQVCPECGAAVNDGAAQCLKCNHSLCPECGNQVDDDDEVCLSCSAVLPMFCSSCGAEVEADVVVCAQCGKPLDT